MAHSNLELLYVSISIVVILADLVTACHTFAERKKRSNYLGVVGIASALVQLFYLLSLFASTYFGVAVFSALYFISVDFAILSLLVFFHVYSTPVNRLIDKIMAGTLFTLFVVDSVLQLVNPFKEIMVHFQDNGGIIARYTYMQLPLFKAHLIYAYILLALALVRIIGNIISVPGVYKRPYVFSFITIIIVAVINGFFLFYPSLFGSEVLDYSIWGYSVATLLIYISCYRYPQVGMRSYYHEWIVENVNQGVALFDYKGDLIIFNKKVNELFPDKKLKSGMTVTEFVSGLELPAQPSRETEDYSLQHYIKHGGRDIPVRFDHRCLTDNVNGGLGQLFVFTNESSEVDLLTSFYTWEKFKQALSDEPETFGNDLIAAVCDINGLGDINRRFGKNSGDQAIKLLSNTIRKHFTGRSFFVRGQEASLIILVWDKTVDEVNKLFDAVRNDISGTKNLNYSLNIQSAIGIVGKDDPDILTVVKQAFMSMKNKKLLDVKSRRSELVTSLVKTLAECDNDTEEHVRRTQALGAELGKRLGLSDMHMSDLALLCILHDIGKIAVPLEILNKPGKLSDSEWRVLRTHADKGYQIATSSQELTHIADMIRHHHESWDGRGYPDGLTKESIPLLSRIIAVVDAYDAMVNDRSYRPAMPVEDAIKELRRCAGTQFDPTIVNEFIRMLPEIGEIESANELDILTVATSSSDVQVPRIDPEVTAVSNVHAVKYVRYVLNDKMRIIEADSGFEELTGYSQDDLKNGVITQHDLLPEEDRTEYLRLVGEQLSSKPLAYFEHRIKRKDGTIIFVFCYGKVYYDSAEKAEKSEIIVFDSANTYAAKIMITEEKMKANLRLSKWEDKYRCDSLTELLNHEAFKNDIEHRLLDSDDKMMLLMMDVDKFKEYNDTFGHKAGDEFLIMLAQALSSTLRKDDLACRMGGDEFAAALFFGANVDNNIMIERAQQICDKLNLILLSNGGGTSLSMGVVIRNKDLNYFDKLYVSADKALYKAKAKGRSRMIVYNESDFEE